MKIWMRKIAVALVTVATLGMYIPTTLLEVDAEDNKENLSSKATIDELASHSVETEQIEYALVSDEEQSIDTIINQLTEKAKKQTITKFGPKIASQVEDEFTEIILPNIESVLQTIVKENAINEGDYTYFAITEQPAKGYGERIFNVYDNLKKQDVATFHVRRDNRPLEGHYFNFHYHLSSDDFKEHHDIGEIYWDKNTPPRWMA